ncbi:MAG: response regulator [Sedimentisphaerales bacterium]
MDNWAKLVEALAALVWPLLVIVVVLRFAPAMRALIESAKSRRFTVKLGGQELTMDEVSEQQGNLIADLQAQVAALREAVGVDNLPSRPTDSPADAAGRTAPVVLWVDDQPKNNSYFVQQLTSGGIDVHLALSTAEGLQRFEGGNYRLVVSDIGRKEEGEYRRRAGLQLLSAIRSVNDKVPVALYTSSRGAREHSREATDLGATLVTSSPTELANLLRISLPEWSA